MKNRYLKQALFATLVSFGCASSAFANTGDIAIGAKASTLGFGGEVTVGLTPNFNARAGYNGYNYSGSTSQNQINYDYKLSLGSYPVLLDWYPFEHSGFRLSPGVIFNNNKVTATGTTTVVGTYTIGGTTYSTATIGSLTGGIDFNKTVPYLGLGWGNAVGKNSGLSFVFDLGVMFQGTPNVSLAATNPVIQADPTFQTNLNKEIADLKDKTDKFKYYPVVSIGLAYAF
ncbi:MAG: hypothetical protein WCI90_03155 [Chlorobium sp.]|nr:MAG: hypothetical protein FDX17_06525 [Chlorobium sp.]